MAGMPPKKSGLLIALGGLKKPSSDSEPDPGEPGESMESDEPSYDAMKSQAADDAFDAIKSGDRSLFADALDRYVKACM
jgi:hypothetical protein